MEENSSTGYLLQHNNTGEFFIDFEYWHDGYSSTDKPQNALEFHNEVFANAFKNEHIYMLSDFSVVKFKFSFSIEKV